MENRGKVSEAVVRRLPVYYRYLEELAAEGLGRISSQELGARMNLTASQIRQDINCFGALGQQGYGYNVAELKRRIGEILGLDRAYNVVVVGAGNVGRAVAHYHGFERMGFSVAALFDADADVVGGSCGGAPILPMGELKKYVKAHGVDIGVVATPASAARDTADLLMRCGIKSIWNFAPVDIAVPEGYAVQNVQLTDSLLILTYHMKNDT